MRKDRGGWIHDGLVLRGDRIWHYINRGNKNVARAFQRLDGFVSVDAGETTGTIITKPFIFDGDNLTLNVDAGEGSVRVGILNLAGREMSSYGIALSNDQQDRLKTTGFRIKDCDPVTSDSVRHVVSWRGNSDVGNLAGTVVRLRIEMQNAKLYAFEFKE
jgi:hypothetical protein